MAETLLLADANPTMQRVVELTCAEHGLKVVSVSDGQQALDYLVAERPALALVSVTLQKLDGFEIASLVRDRPDLQGIPVLLLAGAFETIDEARVRASGAAGVLVKPFEPGLVIKRVKELLGMSTPNDQPSPARTPQPQSGRLVTSVEGSHAADAPAERVEPLPGESPPRDAAETAETWEQLREASGLGPEAAEVATSGSGDDYFGKLDAAFESLDARLAGRSAPTGRVTTPPPTPRIPAAMDPERRPAPPVAPPTLYDQLAAQPNAPRPVLAVDEDWDVPDRRPHGSSSDGGRKGTSVSEDAASASAADVLRERLPATYGEMSPPAHGFAAADAFAMLWAHEQGEPLPPVPPPPPTELSDQTVEAVARRLGDQLTDRVTDILAARITEGLATRITDDLARRISSDLAQRFGDPFAEQLRDGIAGRVADAVSDRLMQHAFGDSLRQTVHDVSERLVREEIARIRAAAKDSPGS